VPLYCAVGDDQAVGDGPVRKALCHQLEHCTLLRGQCSERVAIPATADHPCYDLGIENWSALADPADRFNEAIDVLHAVFEEITDALGSICQQA
jgi:hypothetical protein